MPNQHPSLSVITTATVWGVSTTQTPPVPVHSQSSSAYPRPHPVPSNMQSNFNNNYGAPHPKPNSCDSYHNSSVFPPGHRGMGPVRMGHQGPHINPDQVKRKTKAFEMNPLKLPHKLIIVTSLNFISVSSSSARCCCCRRGSGCGCGGRYRHCHCHSDLPKGTPGPKPDEFLRAGMLGDPRAFSFS